MIIYGTNGKEIGAKRIPGAKCPSCESQNIEVIGFSRYFHIFWIPVLAYKKKVITYCSNCDLEIYKDDIPQRTVDKIKEEKRHMKIPFYHFSGLIIIALIIAYSIYSSNEHEKEVAQNISNLQSLDVLVFKNDDGTYSFAKIAEVSNDTVYMNFSNYVYEGGSPSEYRLNKEKAKVTDFYNNDVYYYMQSTLDSMHQSNEIYDLYRKE